MSDEQKQKLINAIPKWYARMAFYKVLIGILGSVTSVEFLAYFRDVKLPAWAHTSIGVCALFLIVIRALAKDEDGDGTIDILQKKKP